MDKKFFYGMAEEIKIKIIDMINLGQNPIEILLEVSKILSEKSGEKTFYREVHEQIISVYGLGLEDKFVVKEILVEVSERLKKIEKAYQDDRFTDEEHKRMSYAIERHKTEIERLKNLLTEE